MVLVVLVSNLHLSRPGADVPEGMGAPPPDLDLQSCSCRLTLMFSDIPHLRGFLELSWFRRPSWSLENVSQGVEVVGSMVVGFIVRLRFQVCVCVCV